MTDEKPARRSRRGGGREAKRALRAASSAVYKPYVTRNIPVFDILGEEGLLQIEENAEVILEEIGIEFRDDAEALEMW